MAKKIGEFFDSDVAFRLREPGGIRALLRGRKSFVDKVVIARTSLAQLAVSVSGIEIALYSDTAEVELQGKGMGKMPGREDHFLESHRLALKLTKRDGRWQISEVINVDEMEWEYD